MKITNLITAHELMFGETFYLIDIYDEQDPYTHRLDLAFLLRRISVGLKSPCC